MNNNGYNNNGYSSNMSYNNDYGNNWRNNERSGYQRSQGGYQNGGGYQKRGPRPGGFNSYMNPTESSSYNSATNYHRQPDYM